MNNVSKKLCLVLASAALVFAGCSKKPTRPAPRDTVLGQGGSDSGIKSTDVTPTPDGLAQRNGIDASADGLKHGELESVYFDFNESTIKAPERAKIQKAKEYLEKNPGSRLVLEGHCDWRGTPEYNLGLGDRRANAVKKYLGTIGVGADKVETLSKGSLEASKNADEGTAAKDRRVDLLVAPARAT